MTTQCVLDSSVIVAAFRATEPYALLALHVLTRIEQGSLAVFIPTTVVVEVAGAIRRRTGSARIATVVVKKLRSFRHVHMIPVDAGIMDRASALAIAGSLRGMDAIPVAIAEEFHLPLVTLDFEMRARAAPYVEVVDVRSLS